MKIMTNKHKIYYLFWVLLCRLKGLKVGTIVVEYSEGKQKDIKGCITSLNGNSITRTKLGLSIGVNWFEPTQGHDSRVYNWGGYYIEQFKGKRIFHERMSKENAKNLADSYD